MSPITARLVESLMGRPLFLSEPFAKVCAERIAADLHLEGLEEVAQIMRRHTHDENMAAVVSYRSGLNPARDCRLCRALVAAEVLTLADIGAGTREAILRHEDR